MHVLTQTFVSERLLTCEDLITTLFYTKDEHMQLKTLVGLQQQVILNFYIHG